MYNYNFESHENREEDDMEVESTEVTFLDDIDFYVEESHVKKSCAIFLEFEYKDKEDDVHVEQGEIDKKVLSTLTQATTDAQLFTNSFVIVLLKPSNVKLFFGCQLVRSPFVDNPLGRLVLRLHRVIKYDDDAFAEARAKARPVEYANVPLLVKLLQQKKQ